MFQNIRATIYIVDLLDELAITQTERFTIVPFTNEDRSYVERLSSR
jgi:hypothetical protein